MNIKFKLLLLGFGDIVTLAFFFFFTGFSMIPSEPADTFSYMVITTAPFIISWIPINIFLRLFSINLDFGKLSQKLFWACLSNAIIGTVCQYLLSKLLVKYGELTFDVTTIIYIGVGEFLVVIAWRIIYQLLYIAFQFEKYPIIKKFLIASFIFIVGLGIFLVLPRIYTTIRYSNDIYNLSNSPKKPIAIVFGAGLNPDGSPSIVLAERVSTAVKLYQAGKVEKLLMSGGKTSDNDDEPNTMKKMAFELGVPEKNILLDYGGDRAYATCQNAKSTYGLNHAVLVAQNFYLLRTLLICNTLGIASVGVSADDMIYTPQTYFFLTIREVFATDLAFWELYVKPR
jgi:vancomycin permeability regulator SanA